MKAQTAPKVGQWLHASCSDAYFGRITRVGTDANGTDVIDIEVEDINPLNSRRESRRSWSTSHGE